MSIERLNEFWPDWKVTELLGEGSYGKVYKAQREDHTLTSYSAIKVISIPNNPSELRTLYAEGLSEADTKKYLEGIVSDFVNEIKVMESLDGAPNIVFVKDYKILEKEDEIGWDIFIRMELLQPFDRVMMQKHFDEDEAIKVAVDLCTALEACSAHHIIHRDIKPANIFVSQYGTYKIGDFGVARELEKTTGTLSAKGTFGYMAPEVAHGYKYDSTVDIYSLGIVLYTLLNNNRPPFVDPYAAQISYNDRKQATDRRLSGEALLPPCNASNELANIILTACAYNPQQRFKSPTALKNALLNYKNFKNTQPSLIKKITPAIIETDINATIAVPHPHKKESEPYYKNDQDKEYENEDALSDNRDILITVIAIVTILSVLIFPILLLNL